MRPGNKKDNMLKDLRQQIVLITGAAGGFGQELTRQLLEAGSYLLLADVRKDQLQQAVEGVVARIRPTPSGKILGIFAADLSTTEGAEELYRQCQAVTPYLDVLINNAGIGLSGPIQEIPQAKWERLMQVNLLAPMRLTAKFLPAMIERRNGHIVNVSSVAGLVGSGGLTAYCASKHGLRGFSNALRHDVRPHGIDVTTIYPFFTRTPILQSEQFGGQQRALPDWLIYDPAQVMAVLIEGIRRRKTDIYPGAIPRLIDTLQRLAPWSLRLLGG